MRSAEPAARATNLSQVMGKVVNISNTPYTPIAAAVPNSARSAAATQSPSAVGFAAALGQVAAPASTTAAPSGFAAALEKVGLPASDAARFAPNERSTLSYLTPADREMVQAATGLVVSSDGIVQNPRWGEGMDNFVSALASERYNGRIEGEVTSGYLKDLFAKYNVGGTTTFDPAYLDAALSFMDARDQRRSEDPTPRSSFSLGV